MFEIISLAPMSATGLAVAFFCGFIIGLERQWIGKPAGIRTSILICMAVYTFVAIAHGMVEEEYAVRVVGAVVTGVGFLGAGVIIGRDGLVAGVTSAAIIWILAAMGCLIAFKYHTSALALSVITVAVLIGISFLEQAFRKLKRGVHKHHKDRSP